MEGIIYKVTNTQTNKVYIGQTILSLKERRQGHYDTAKKPSCKTYFGRTLLKYPKECFIWEAIDHADTILALDEKERYWISYYKSTNRTCGYNLKTGGGSGSSPNEDLRKKLSEANKNQCNRKGCHYSEEGKKNASLAQKRKWETFTEEEKTQKVAGMLEYRKTHVFVMSEEHKRIIGEAARKSNIGRKMSESTKQKHAEAFERAKRKYPDWNERVSKGLKEYWKDPEKRKQLGNALRGKIRSEETRKKLSISHMGHVRTKESIQKGQETRRRNKALLLNKEAINGKQA